MNDLLLSILYSALAVSVLGCVFAFLLSFLAKKFAVHQDPKVKEVEEALAQLNCGACGYANCASYADAVVHHDADPSLCSPGGEETAQKVAHIVGKDFTTKTKKIAKLLCRGGNLNAPDKYDYDGVETCLAATLVSGGPKACIYGCIGFGDCFRACNYEAIVMKDGLPVIDRDKCVGCMACVKACPKNIIEMVPHEPNRVFVECLSKDKGAVVVKNCKVGCIACFKCEKICPFDAIHVKDNIAVIDYEKCTSCGKCVKECPRNIILMIPRKKVPQEKVKKSK